MPTPQLTSRWPWAALRRRALGHAELLLPGLAALLALAVVVQYLRIAAASLGYPFQLEWMEGGIVETVSRLRNGEALYRAPSLEYVAYLYPPLYFWVVEALSHLTGVGFLAARVVSFASILGCGAVTFRFVQKESGSALLGLLGVGLLFSSYEAAGRWFHLARVDSLGLLLLLWPLHLLRAGTGPRSAALAGALLFLAFLTKQNALLACAPVLLAMLLFDRRRALIAGGLLAALSAGAVLALDASSDGWFSYFVLELPGKHPLHAGMLLGFWRDDLAGWGVPLALAAVGIVAAAAERPRTALFDLALAAGLFAVAWSGRLHSGGFLNALLPAFAALAWLAPLGAAALVRRLAAGERERHGGSPTVIALGALAALQLAIHLPLLEGNVPAAGAVAEGEAFLAGLRELPGDVLLPDCRFVQRAAGKHSYGLEMAARDVLRAEDPRDRGRLLLEQELADAVASRRFSAVVVSEDAPLVTLAPHYRLRGPVAPGPEPVTGWKIRPAFVWEPAP